MSKITLSTVKSFIKKNRANMWINLKSKFDGMTDMVEQRNGGFVVAKETGLSHANTMNIEGAWFVLNSRDYFTPYKANGFEGIEVNNSCGCFILAIKQ